MMARMILQMSLDERQFSAVKELLSTVMPVQLDAEICLTLLGKPL